MSLMNLKTAPLKQSTHQKVQPIIIKNTVSDVNEAAFNSANEIIC